MKFMKPCYYEFDLNLLKSGNETHFWFKQGHG